MTPAERDNLLRWDGKRKGHYEVYYFKFNDASAGVAMWLRYTLLIPLARPGVGELWGIFFDAHSPRENRAWKQSFPIEQVSSQSNPFELRIHDAILGHDMARGEIASDLGTLRWDLRVNPATRSVRSLPPLLYLLPIPKTKVIAPNQSCTYSGTVDIGDRTLQFSDAPGHQAHIWGSKHAAQWAWAHCNIFEGAKDVVFEALSGQIKMMGRLTPPMSSIYLKAAGCEYHFNSYRQLFATRSQWGLDGWTIEAQGRGARILAQVSSTPESMVGVRYEDPDGEPRVCNNTKVADMTVTLWETNEHGEERAQTWVSKQCCAYEMVGPHALPEVPVKI